MDQLRSALGVEKIDFYGMSYGTALGSVYAQLFPSHVGAMVLDGAVDANLSLISDAKADAPAIETALTHGAAELHRPSRAARWARIRSASTRRCRPASAGHRSPHRAGATRRR